MANDTFVFKMMVNEKSGERHVYIISLIEWLSDAQRKNPHISEFIEFLIDQLKKYKKDQCVPVRDFNNWLSNIDEILIKRNILKQSWFIEFFIRQLWKEIHTVN